MHRQAALKNPRACPSAMPIGPSRGADDEQPSYVALANLGEFPSRCFAAGRPLQWDEPKPRWNKSLKIDANLAPAEREPSIPSV